MGSDKIRLGERCNHFIYGHIIALLSKMSGITWGFVRGPHRIKYVTCKELPYLIGILTGKGYERRIKYKLDLEIGAKYPRAFGSEKEWLGHLALELREGLTRLLRERPPKNLVENKLIELRQKVRSYPIPKKISADVLTALNEARRDGSVKIGGEDTAVDYYIDSTRPDTASKYAQAHEKTLDSIPAGWTEYSRN